MKKPKILLAVFLLSLLIAPAGAQEKPDHIEVSGLLGDKAVVTVNGARHLLAVGETSPEGITLVAVETDGVRLEIDDQARYFPLGSSQVRGRYAVRRNVQERIYRGSNGMFTTPGSINGTPVEFLVDTGATTVAMGPGHARRLGIDYRRGLPVSVSTASGNAAAWRVTLDEVGVGQIKLNNIDAVVIEKSGSSHILLGMSFLDRLSVQHEGRVMVLEMKY